MRTILLRRLPLLVWLVFVGLAVSLARPALASHLLGGELTYRYLDSNGPAAAPLRYELATSVYVACNSAATTAYLDIDFFNVATGTHLTLSSTNVGSSNAAAYYGALEITQSSISTCTTIAVPAGCTITGASQPYQLQKFVGIVCLPLASAGYYALAAPSGARNAGINNLAGGGGASAGYSLGLYATLAAPVYTNHSPVFTGEAVGLICAGDTTVVLNNAVDADGDRLVYAFGQPYDSPYTTNTTFVPPLPAVPYTSTGGYSAATPLGTGAGYYAKINPNTGITKYVGGAAVGNRYSIAVDVTEYRTINGVEVALGTTRRDIQLIVGNCPAVAPPVLPTVAVLPRSYTVEVGSTLTIPVTGTQPAGHPLTLTATSALLDGSGGYNATFAGSPGTPTYASSPVGASMATGTTGGSVAGTFVYTPACTEARATPYDVTLLLRDVGCAGKLTSDVLRITVVKPTGPTAIAGSLAVCGLGTQQTYTASGGTAPTVQWTVTGGILVGSATANPVTVQWPTAGTGTLKAQGLSQYGCPVEAVTQTVAIGTAAPLTLTGSPAICRGGSTTLAVSGGTAPYTVTGGPAPVSGAGPFVLSPTQTTTYTVAGAASGSACAATAQLTIVVSAPPIATAGADVTVCSGGTTQLGAAPAAGYTYSWSPVTNLSSSTVANPTVTLVNTTGAPLTQTYTLTATNPATNCQATDQVLVTVAPLAVASAGAPLTLCSGGTGQLGAAPAAGYTYSWSPTTGLSSSTVANPTVTLTNATGTATTQTYTLTATAAGGCPSTGTVAVTVSPQPVADAGPAVSFCSGGTGQLGAAAVAGITYSWSPATGLSSSTVANPTVTLTNSTGSAVTQTYTLTATSAGSCSATSLVAVTVNPLPTAAAGAPVAFCSGGTGQLGAAPAAGYTYSWSPTTGLSNASVANPTVTLTNTTGAPITQTYTLSVTGAGSCAGTSTVPVTVNPKPVANAGLSASFCSGGTAQLGAAPVAGYTYSWSPTTGLSNAGVANPIVTLTNNTGAPITQTYTLTVANAAGCSATSLVAVTVNPLPAANAGPAVSFCSGGTGQLGAAPVVGYTYRWSPTTGLSNASIANPTVTLTTATGAPLTQTYTLMVASAAGCSATSTVAVTANPLPVATTGAPVAFCSGESAQLGAAPVAGYTYSWSPAAGLSSATVANPTVTLTNPTSRAVTQTYTLTVASAAGCSASSPVAVTVHPLPVATVAAPIALCSGSAAPLGAAPVAGVGYSWKPATGLSDVAVANPTVTLTNATSAPITQTYTLTATNPATGCVSTGTVVVTVSPLPTAPPGAAITLCSGSTGQLGAAPVAGYTYRWSPVTGLSNAAIANPTVTLTNATTAPATQAYTLTVTNAATCASTSPVAVTVNPAVVPGTIGGDQTVCAGGVPAPLTSLAPASGGPGTYDYQWETSTDNVTWKAVATVTSPGYAPSAVTTTTYFRRRVLTGACGLYYTNVVTVHAQQLLIPTVVLPTPPPTCVGTAMTFVPVPANAGSAPNYQWFINGASIGTGPTLTSTTLADGDVVGVMLTPTPGFCATGTALGTVQVRFTPVPAPTLTIKLQTALPVCLGAPISFSLDRATSLGANPQYQWQVDGAAVSGATKASFTSTALRNGQAVSLLIRTTNACGQPATVTSGPIAVQVNPPVHVSAGPDKTIVEGESVTLDGTADGSYPVTWTPAPTLAFANGDQLHPVATPLVTTTYTLSAGAGYCADQSSVTVTVRRRLRIPSAFSPNADNNDDTWQIAGIEDYPANHVEVFNRWGQKLFEASGYGRSSEWNGTYKGELLPFGTYYYLLTLGNGKSYTGPLTVLR